MRFFVTGEWTRNRLLQVIVALYALYVSLLWLTNALLYFSKMSLAPASVVAYYLGNEERLPPAAKLPGPARGLPLPLVRDRHVAAGADASDVVRAAVRPLEGLADQPCRSWREWSMRAPAGWCASWIRASRSSRLRASSLLQGSLAVLVGVSLWAVFVGSQESYEDSLYDSLDSLDGLADSMGSEDDEAKWRRRSSPRSSIAKPS